MKLIYNIEKRGKKNMRNNYVDRKVLESWGFVSATSEDGREWTIMRNWRKVGRSNECTTRKIKISTAVCKHPYGTNKSYPTLAFSADSRIRSMTLARFLYAWFVGPVTSDMDVDHIDNDCFNNNISNLRLVTRAENIRKKFTDSDCNVNQYGRRKAIEIDTDLPREYYTRFLDMLENMMDVVSGDRKIWKRLNSVARTARGMIVYWDRAHGQERTN